MNYLIPVVAVAVLSSLFSGCVLAKYKLADERARPAVPINIRGVQPPVELNLKNVIIYRGPGSWKQNAYWDEYEVSVTNSGATPLTMESVALTDFQGLPAEPGDNPWTLEQQSRTYEAAMANAHKDLLKVGGGAVLIGSGGALVALTTMGFGAPLAIAAIPTLVAAPIVIGVSIKKNNNRKRLIESTFAQRRLVLPATIAPGQSAQGSLFFRITPGPRSFSLHYRDGGEPRQVSFELARLSTLHLAAP